MGQVGGLTACLYRLGDVVAWDSDGTLSGYDSFEVTLGDQLRGERATKGKSLLDVQRELRIKAAYIAAIENCDLEVFPNRGFVAGYVRSYARYLGLDGELIYRRFCDEAGFSGVNADIQGRQKPKNGKTGAALKIDLKNDPLSRGMMGKTAQTSRFDFSDLVGSAASVLVMAALLGGVGYGGWRVLQEIQRVELAPVAQTPAVADEAVSQAAAPSVDVDAGVEVAGPVIADRNAALERLYRPEPLVPVLAPRDGPIAAIDPDAVGSFASRVAREVESTGPEVAVAAVDATVEMDIMPSSAEELLRAADLTPPPPPTVAVVAAQAAWIRVSQSDGATLFETILEAGQAYEVPLGVEAPELRAGNSGSVFLRVGDKLYGPLGSGPRVAKQVSLKAEDIPLNWSVAEPTEDQRAALEGVLIGIAERTARVAE